MFFRRPQEKQQIEHTLEKTRQGGLFNRIGELLGGGDVTITPVPIPRDTPDWHLGSFWAHPERVLDRAARDARSSFARARPEVVERVVRDVARDLTDGAWDARYGALRALDADDGGLRLIVAR